MSTNTKLRFGCIANRAPKPQYRGVDTNCKVSPFLSVCFYQSSRWIGLSYGFCKTNRKMELIGLSNLLWVGCVDSILCKSLIIGISLITKSICMRSCVLETRHCCLLPTSTIFGVGSWNGDNWSFESRLTVTTYHEEIKLMQWRHPLR